MKQLIGFIILFALVAFKDDNREKRHFFDSWHNVAQYHQQQCGIPASIQLAQAWYESHGGNDKDVALCSNNCFGIRAFSDWKGEIYTTAKGTKYRAYSTLSESWEDHAKFLHKHYTKAVGKDWRHWVKWCRGYGGHPDYWGELGKIIEQNELWKYDRI